MSMSMHLIPAHWVVRRSTPFFTRDNVPPALLSHQCNIFFETMVVINCYIPVRSFKRLAGNPDKGVPDRCTFSIFIPSSLDLIGGRGRTP